VSWSTRWPGQSTPHPWVANTYPEDRAATRDLGARLRAGDDGRGGRGADGAASPQRDDDGDGRAGWGVGGAGPPQRDAGDADPPELRAG